MPPGPAAQRAGQMWTMPAYEETSKHAPSNTATTSPTARAPPVAAVSSSSTSVVFLLVQGGRLRALWTSARSWLEAAVSRRRWHLDRSGAGYESRELARDQLKDRDDPFCLPGLLAVGGVPGEDAVSKIPQSLPVGFVLHEFSAERQIAENNVGMLAQVVVPGWVRRPPPLRRDDRHAIAVVEVERGIPTRLACPRTSLLKQRRGKRPRGAEPSSSTSGVASWAGNAQNAQLHRQQQQQQRTRDAGRSCNERDQKAACSSGGPLPTHSVNIAARVSRGALAYDTGFARCDCSHSFLLYGARRPSSRRVISASIRASACSGLGSVAASNPASINADSRR